MSFHSSFMLPFETVWEVMYYGIYTFYIFIFIFYIVYSIYMFYIAIWERVEPISEVNVFFLLWRTNIVIFFLFS